MRRTGKERRILILSSLMRRGHQTLLATANSSVLIASLIEEIHLCVFKKLASWSFSALGEPDECITRL